MKTLSNLCIVFSLIFIAVLCQAQQTANLPSPTPYTANQTIADSTWGVANGTTTWIMNNVQGIDSLGRGLINDVSPSLQVSPNNQALDVPQDYLNTLAPEFGIDPNGPPARLFTDTIPVSLTAATFLTPGGEEEGGLMLWEGVANATEGTANKTIGLGLVSDLANHRGTGAITYANAGWQKAGLTSVDYDEAALDDSAFKKSFEEASQNANAIRFDVSSFDVAYPHPGMTSFEFNHIINNPSLLGKTTFIQNGQQVIWSGTGFVKP